MGNKGVTGSCLCGDIRWECDTDDESEGARCHCSMCRKQHGTPFTEFFTIKDSQIRWVAGEHLLSRDKATATSSFERSFCPRCGSAGPVFGEGWVVVHSGSLDSDPGVRPCRHIFVGSSPTWFEITDWLPQYEEYSGVSIANTISESTKLRTVRPPSAGGTTAGVVSGSCLCGGVEFRITEPFSAVYNCYCGRCRKGRSGVHATNGFVSANAIQFVRGEQNLEQYKVPEARFFTQVFCRDCGALMPRIDPGRGVAIVPFGSLDADPGTSPECSIFVADKPPWFDITDSLPQYEEGPR